MAIQESTRTYGQLARTVKRQFGDESGAQITNEDIVSWTNLGRNEIATLTRYFKKTSTLVSTGQTEPYAFPAANAIEIDAFLLNGRPVPFRNFQEHINLGNIPVVGDTAYWTNYGAAMILVPYPAKDTVLELYYSDSPEPITGLTSEILGIPDKYYEALLDYVLARAYELDEDTGLSGNYQAKYLSRLAETNGEEYNQANSTYPTISILE